MPEPVGLLPVDKPEGPTSHDQVALARRLLGIRRIGHTGTLDPFASGLLLLCLGWATRLAEYTALLSKTYDAVARLGATTTTDDGTGEIVAANEAWRDLTDGDVHAALRGMVGLREQRPPTFSAKKVNGERAYDIARRGGQPELRPQAVEVHRIDLLEFSPPVVSFQVECSAGTYIRSLARDLGAELGVGGHLERLRRTAIGAFRVEDAVTLAPEATRTDLERAILPPGAAVAHLPRVELDAQARRALGHGQPVSWDAVTTDGPLAVFVEGDLAAIGEMRGGKLWPRKVLVR